jgi:hypothetical protein
MRGPIIMLLLCFPRLAFAQDKIEVSFDKGVILVFEIMIKDNGWHLGSKEQVGIAVKENKVLLQANEESFDETNLLIELVDGSMYAFDLVYNNTPAKKIYPIARASAAIKPATPTAPGNITKEAPRQPTDGITAPAPNAPQNAKPVESDLVICKNIVSSPDYLKRIGVVSRKMFLYVGGLYVFNDKLYFKVNLKNVSTIPFDLDYAQFIIRNQKTGLSKSISGQVERLDPVYIHLPDKLTVDKDEVATFVYVFEKFTISDSKKLCIEFWEKKGDRNLEVLVESIEILNAKNGI